MAFLNTSSVAGLLRTGNCSSARVDGNQVKLCSVVGKETTVSGQYARVRQRKAVLLQIDSMADIGRSKPNIGGGKFEQDTGKGGVVTIQKPEVKKKSKREEKTDREPNWRVLLHNDDVHTFDYVTGVIVKVVKTVSRRKAHRITMQAHSHGIATVTTTWKAMAEEYCKGLQVQGLTSSIAPDSSFK
uniref:Adaptor protein ClpS core domain-containing protein n=1 Tax=Timspurckia oligopyrenoides TaxID=708627 RepID=A0A7S0ZKG5_9RHOD|mmetsp:Transcript_8841/g.15921  ORF Transcript_8841/g.15921 Transcript_8841/m.15921 type:complete len:186 (+) Transcript_8841:206-763(+)|eukprot:CAMPEP_0182447520 /NCGR_PEP_ID=MMETSP1172-20130603/16955_1 /TAXON_ID=708627 /ORGANISM="Timspurckia oligopyrenoides, Strain CCMP3278" /LENGTH=185 /DNA_ID=CAMNT_0024643987 /DNA_START=179 /DNA_END=736 /DNA_ORIENTATION=+